jgi:hypothetical protein
MRTRFAIFAALALIVLGAAAGVQASQREPFVTEFRSGLSSTAGHDGHSYVIQRRAYPQRTSPQRTSPQRTSPQRTTPHRKKKRRRR